MKQRSPHHASRRKASLWRRGIQALSLACVILGSGLNALADDVQTNGLWIPNISIQGVTRGELQYTTNLGADMSIPLSQIQGIKVPAFPDLWAAQEAILAKNDAAALPLLQRVEGQSRQAWLKHYAAWQRIHTLDRLGRAIEAAEAYLALARSKPAADAYYLQRPPLTSLPNASAVQKQDLHKRLTQAQSEFEGIAKAGVEAMIAQLGPIETPAASPAQPATDGAASRPSSPSSNTTPAVALPVTPAGGVTSVSTPQAEGIVVSGAAQATNRTGVVMSSFMAPPDRDEVSALLYQGKWEDAAARCKQLLAGHETRLSMRLYQQGIALLQIAEKTGDEATYKEAGISLSRSVIYFPTSGVAGPGLVELAYIHQKINRPDLAKRLLDKARLQVDETQDPQVFSRMEKIIADLSTASDATLEPATPQAQ